MTLLALFFALIWDSVYSLNILAQLSSLPLCFITFTLTVLKKVSQFGFVSSGQIQSVLRKKIIMLRKKIKKL